MSITIIPKSRSLVGYIPFQKFLIILPSELSNDLDIRIALRIEESYLKRSKDVLNISTLTSQTLSCARPRLSAVGLTSFPSLSPPTPGSGARSSDPLIVPGLSVVSSRPRVLTRDH